MVKLLITISLLALLCGCTSATVYESRYPIISGTWDFTLFDARGDALGNHTKTFHQNGESLIETPNVFWKGNVWRGSVSLTGNVKFSIAGKPNSGSMAGVWQGTRMEGEWNGDDKRGRWKAERIQGAEQIGAR